MSKINKITVDVTPTEEAIEAMIALFTPFGSLMTTESEGRELAKLIVNCLKEHEQSNRAAHVADILRALWSAETDTYADLLVTPRSLQLITPTSQTPITISKYGHSLEVCVDFGANGSSTRAMEILEVLLAREIPFTAVAGDDQLSYQQCVTFVLNDWAVRLQYVDESEDESCYPQRDHVASQVELFSRMLAR